MKSWKERGTEGERESAPSRYLVFQGPWHSDPYLRYLSVRVSMVLQALFSIGKGVLTQSLVILRMGMGGGGLDFVICFISAC